MNKWVKGGKVAVIISPGFGAGWSTWGDEKDKQAMLFDAELARRIEAEAPYPEWEALAMSKWPDAYLGGLDQAVVEWVDVGDQFFVDEYDGSESLQFCGGPGWVQA